MREVERRPSGVAHENRGHDPAGPQHRFDVGGLANVAADGPDFPEFATCSYAAHFIEVRVEPTTRRIRVPRVVSVLDSGRIISQRTAESQVRGGVVWGIGAALQEDSEVDERFGGFLNSNLADDVIPVHADIGRIRVELVNEPDPRFNGIGLKSVGEVAMCGVAPAGSRGVATWGGTARRPIGPQGPVGGGGLQLRSQGPATS